MKLFSNLKIWLICLSCMMFFVVGQLSSKLSSKAEVIAETAVAVPSPTPCPAPNVQAAGEG